MFDSDDHADCYLVDEIGRMECMSVVFIEVPRRLMDSGIPMAATVAGRGEGFIAETNARQDAEIRQETKENRNRLPMRVHILLCERCS